MKCPKCGQELRRSPEEPNIGLCDNCMLKFDWVDTRYCQNCGSQLEGNFCPNCGAPANQQVPFNQNMQQQNGKQPKKKGGCLKVILIVFAVLIVLGFLMSLLGSDSDDSSDTNDSKTESSANDSKAGSSTSDSQESEAEEDLITVGSSFEVGDLKITINEANTNFTDYDDPYDLYAPADGMKYVMVSFTFENIGDSGDEYVSIYDFDCFADNTSCEQEYGLDDGDFINTNLSPGRNISFKTYYAVPQNATSIELEYRESVWNDNRVLIKIQ